MNKIRTSLLLAKSKFNQPVHSLGFSKVTEMSAYTTAQRLHQHSIR